MKITKNTVLKHDTPGPRYTSYPTAPEWRDNIDESLYRQKLKNFGQSDKTLSLYVHIPFCQSMCRFCACSVVIRPHDPKYGDQYLEYLFKEIDLLRETIGTQKVIRQLHWGGGTPTFLNEDQIERLFLKIKNVFTVDLTGEIAVEIDPRTIDKSKIIKLRELGFNRVSMGVQDFDENVQVNVNRVQPFEMVRDVNMWCRELGFESMNFDLIYGLPRQTKQSFHDTVEKVIGLRPDRIALYSFAYVPWLKKHQNKIDKETLPSSDEKLDIFLSSREQFLDGEYQAIAMDHFALKSDEMAKAFNENKLYRNFMGYTVKPADEYIGLGMSAIGFLEDTFIQNKRTLPEYFKTLDDNKLPVERGKVLTEDDRIRQWTVGSLMCRFNIDKDEFQNKFQHDFDVYFDIEQDHIKKCIEDGLLKVDPVQIQVTELGKIFIRNICMGFDWYLRQKQAHQQFSQTV